MHGESLEVLKSGQTSAEHRGEGTCPGSECRLEGNLANEVRPSQHRRFLLRVPLGRAALVLLYSVYLFGLVTANLSFDFF